MELLVWLLKRIQVACSPPEVNKVGRRGAYIDEIGGHDSACTYLLPPPFDSDCNCGA